MTAADLHKRQDLFYSVIDQVEKDYHLYFGLKSIQKKLCQTERIYDHFILSHDTLNYLLIMIAIYLRKSKI